MKIGITFSVSDLFHARHLKILEESKRYCNCLVVGLQTDSTFDRLNKIQTAQTVVEGIFN
jgi:glycerol-3-phosphate cytidylyltransferase